MCIHFYLINTSESRRSSLVEIQEESEEGSSNTDNSKDCNGSTGFVKSRSSVSEDSNESSQAQKIQADGIATNVSQRGENETKCLSKPKSILKNSKKLRRGSTP